MRGPRTDTTRDKRRLLPLRWESLLTGLRGETAEEGTQPAAARSRAAGFSFAVVSGYVVGVAGFYTNFFDTLLQATAGLVDVLGTIFLIWLFVRYRRQRPQVAKPMVVLLAGVTLLLMGGLTYAAAHPPGPPAPGSDETCVYDVSAGVSIPLEAGGLIKQEIPVRADRVFAISVIIGLDPTTADPSLPHPVDVRVRDAADGSTMVLRQPDIRDNRLTRFNFPRTLSPGDETTTLTFEVINKSAEQIGVYVKVPDDGDIVPPGLSGVMIRGHAGQQEPYRRPDWTLAGCIAGERPAST